MLALFNITDSSVQLVPSSLQLKSTPDEALFVRIMENLSAGAPPTERLLAAGESLELVILPKGHREGNSLVITGSVTRDAAMGAYCIPINAHTDAVVALLQLGDNDPSTDVLAKEVEGWLRLVQVSPARPILSAAFAISLVSAPSFDDIGSPTAIPGADTKYLRFDAATQTLSGDDKTRVLARIGAATAAQGAKADTAAQPADITTAVAAEATARNSAITTAVAAKEPTQTLVSQADAEAGVSTATDRKWSVQRIWQAITAKIASLFASQAQAEAGTDNATLMTPLRVAQAITALGGGGGGGGGGPVNWGAIGGTLADQTDLATALSAKIEIGLDGKLPTADGSNLTAVRDGTAVHWRGDFLSSATYAANDISVLDGVPYLCLTPGAYAGIAVGSDWAKLVPLLPLMDTGWSASVSGSNKTDALPTYTSTNFDSVDSGLTALSAQVAFLTTRVAALQEAMRDGLRPNA